MGSRKEYIKERFKQSGINPDEYEDLIKHYCWETSAENFYTRLFMLFLRHSYDYDSENLEINMNHKVFDNMVKLTDGCYIYHQDDKMKFLGRILNRKEGVNFIEQAS